MKLANSHPGLQGKSTQELIWERLDALYDSVVSATPTNPQLPYLKGQCLGLATGLAMIRNPVAPDVEWVRQQAAERHRRRAIDGQGGTQ